VRLIEARDLPKPIQLDASKTDQAHSNPYVKVSVMIIETQLDEWRDKLERLYSWMSFYSFLDSFLKPLSFSDCHKTVNPTFLIIPLLFCHVSSFFLYMSLTDLPPSQSKRFETNDSSKENSESTI